MQAAQEASHPDGRWWRRPVALIELGALRAADAETTPRRTEILIHALAAGRRRPDIIPRPGEPGWEEYLSFLEDTYDGQSARLEPLRIPVVTVPGTVTVTLTEVWDTEPWLPPHLRDRHGRR
jgi:hypothetical protein